MDLELVFGNSNAKPDSFHIEYGSDVDDDYILKQIRCEYPKYEKCEFTTQDNDHLGGVKSFEQMETNNQGKRVVHVLLSMLPNIGDLARLGPLKDILPTNKNKDSKSETAAVMWSYDKWKDVEMLITYPFNSILGYSVNAWAVYSIIFGVMFTWCLYFGYCYKNENTIKEIIYPGATLIGFLSTLGVILNGKVCFCWKKIDVLKSKRLSYTMCYGEWDSYIPTRTSIEHVVDKFCQHECYATCLVYPCYAYLIRLSILKKHNQGEPGEWADIETGWYVTAFFTTYLMHGTLYSIIKLFWFWKRQTKNTKWVAQVWIAHIMLFVILLNVMIMFVAREYHFDISQMWVWQIVSFFGIAIITYKPLISSQ